VAVVDPADVGAAAAAALAGGHDGREYVLTGPEAIDFPAAELELPPPIQALFAALRAGVAARPTDAVEALTGRPPRAFAAYTRELNKGVVRRVFEEVIPRGDRDAMHALMAPGFRDHDPLPGQPAGAAAGAYVVDAMHGAQPDLRFAIDDLVAEGDRVTIRWTLRGTHTGPLLGRPPTGRPVELKAIVIFRLAAGRLAERWAGWKPGFAPF
jgi:predicted ester cyclase